MTPETKNTVVRSLRLGLMALLVCAGTAWSGAPSGRLVPPIDGAEQEVRPQALVYEATDPAELRFETETGSSLARVTRWGEPRKPQQGTPSVTLRDGSLLVAKRSWAAGGVIEILGGKVRLRRSSGWLEIDRAAVERIDLEPARGLGSLSASTLDRVRLVGKDTLEARVETLAGERCVLILGKEELEIDASTIVSIALAGQGGEASPAEAFGCWVGLDDGSLLWARRVRADDAWLIVDAFAGFTLRTTSDRLAFLQPLGGVARYLSDLEPVDYRHTPYFDLAWPYARDRRIDGERLAAGGRRAVKGIAMHSASRLVYRIDGWAKRFRSEVAVADPASEAAPAGSVVARVYLVRGGRFDLAYESPVIRGGERPRPIDVDLEGAAAIALVVDYADRGDAGDQALWLDARLIGGAERGDAIQ